MRVPTAAFLAGSTKQAGKHHGLSRMADAEAGTSYYTEWSIPKKLEQPHMSKQRRIGPLSALDNKAAYDPLGEHTADSAYIQLFNEGTVPKVRHKTYVIRVAKCHASMLGTDLRNFRDPSRKQLSSTTKAKKLAFANANMRTNWKLVLFTELNKFSFKHPAVKVDNVTWLKGSEGHIASQVDHSSTTNIYAGISPFGMTLAHDMSGTTGLKAIIQNKKGHADWNITSEMYGIVMKSPFF